MSIEPLFSPLSHLLKRVSRAVYSTRKRCVFSDLHRFDGIACLSILVISSIHAVVLTRTVHAQFDLSDTPVYTDDSPEASESIARAQDQVERENYAEAVRLYQRLLDEFGPRLMARNHELSDESKERNASPLNEVQEYVSVRSRVHEFLLADEELLRQYREASEPVAARRFSEGDAFGVYLARMLTPSGLEASLALAESQIRTARFDAALRTLTDLEIHPDFSSDSVQRRLSRLRALASIYTSDSNTFENSSRALESLPGTEAERLRLQSLHKIVTSEDAFDVAIMHPLDPVRNPSLEQVRTVPVWRVDFHSGPEDALRHKALSPNQRQQIRAESESGQFANMAVTASHDIILATDGISVYALDRFDGREVWRFPQSTELHTLEKKDLRRGGPNGGASELSTVATDGNVAIAVIFQPGDTQLGRISTNRIVCLDFNTGRLRWSVSPSRIDPTFVSASFQGSPLLSSGRLFVTIRTHRQRLASEYLVSIDLNDGSVRWTRYLVSSATSRSWVYASPTIPLLHRGVIYVASPFGCLAATDAETGLPLWVHVEPPDPDVAGPQLRVERAWETSQPVMTSRGLLAISPNLRSMALLDSESGERLASLPITRPGRFRYLLGDGKSVFAVGDSIMRLQVDDLLAMNADALRENRRDQFQEDPEDAIWETVFSPQPGERLFGRVALGSNRLVVPTDRQIYLVDTETARVQQRASHAAPGTPLVIDGEVLMATSEGIDSYMPYELAEPRLRARIEANPEDPTPAISLARLAGRHHWFDDILPAVDLAIDAINLDPLSERGRRTQDLLFQTLLELVDDPALARVEGVGRRQATDLADGRRVRNSMAEDLFVRLDLIAARVDQRLEYLFTYGAFLSREGRPGSAVDAYQRILTTPTLASGLYEQSERQVRARYEALRRLRDLVNENGASIYALHEKAAQDALDLLLTSSIASTNDLMSIAARFPLATSAGRAALEAGRREFRAGRPVVAVELWRKGLSLAPSMNMRGQLLAELVLALESAERYEAVLRELRMAERQHPTMMLVDVRGNATSIAAYREAFLVRLGAMVRLPRIGPASGTKVAVIDGDELLLPLHGRPAVDRALVRFGREIRAYGTPEFNLLWRIPIDWAQTGLLAIDGDDALLWGADRSFPKTVERISLDDGATIWKTSIWGQDDDNGLNGSNTSRRFGRTGRRIGRIDPVVGIDEIIFAISSGDVVCVDRTTGDIRWTRRGVLSDISHVVADPFGIVLAGNRRLDEIDQAPHLLVLDPISGETVAEFEPPTRNAVRWMASDTSGRVVVAMLDVVACYDLQQREERWKLEGSSAALGDEPAMAGNMLFVTDADGKLQTIDTTNGRTTSISALSLEDAGTSPPRIYEWLGQFVLKTGDGVYVFEPDGTRTGELARSGSSDLSIAAIAVASDRAVVLETRDSSASRTRRDLVLYQMDRTGKRVSNEFMPSTPLPKIDAAQALDDWVLVDAGGHVLIFSTPAEP